MKNIASVICILLSLNSFTQTLDIEDPSYNSVGAYYKDINNVLTPFIGTYVYTNDMTIFKIVLQKQVHSNMNDVYFEDLIIGEYQYIENGTEKINTLNNLNISYPDGSYHDIYGRAIMVGNIYGCTDCTPTEKWIYGTIADPVSGSADRLFINKRIVRGKEAIKIFIYHEIGTRSENDPPPIPISYPVGESFTLIKQ